MRRLIWFSLGAAVGIAAYRRWLELAEDARRQGIVPTVQETAVGVIATVNSARGLIGGQSREESGRGLS